jgi:hypothetical protein
MIRAMMKKLLITAILFYMSAHLFSQVNPDSIEAVLRRLNNSITAGDTESIKDDLHPRFAVSITSMPKSGNYLRTLLRQKAAKAVRFVSINRQEGDTVFVDAAFTDSNNKIRESLIAFDRTYKLLFIDFFDRLYSPGRYAESKLQGKIPFTFEGDGIIVDIRLNDSDEPLRFLFDSGADGMAIKKELAERLGLDITRRQNTQVVGGAMQIDISSGNTVHLNESLSLENQNIAIFEEVGHQVDGIIGLNLAYSHIVHVDFDENMISLYSMGDHRFAEGGQRIEITVPHGVIRLPATLDITGGKEVTGSFVLDTGANYSVICFEGFVRRNRLLLDGFKSEGQGTTASMGVVSPVYYGKSHLFRLGEHIRFHDMPVTLQASTGRQAADDQPDGSIGIQLLSRFNFTIDLLRKKIHLVPNKNFSIRKSCS